LEVNIIDVQARGLRGLQPPPPSRVKSFFQPVAKFLGNKQWP